MFVSTDQPKSTCEGQLGQDRKPVGVTGVYCRLQNDGAVILVLLVSKRGIANFVKDWIDFFFALCFGIKSAIQFFESIDLCWVKIGLSVLAHPTLSNIKANAAEKEPVEDEGVRGHAVRFDPSKHEFLVSIKNKLVFTFI